MTQQNIQNIATKYKNILLKVRQGKMTEKQALKNIKPAEFLKLLQPQFALVPLPSITLTGVAVSSGFAVGKLFFNTKSKEKSILVKEKITQRDYSTIRNASAIITIRGGIASPGILMARGLGIPIVVLGNNKVVVDKTNNKLLIDDKVIDKGKMITVDGYRGKVIIGRVKTTEPISELSINRIIKLINKTNKNNVLSFASSIKQVLKANQRGFGVAIRSEDLIATIPKMLQLFQNYILTTDKKKQRDYSKRLMVLQTRQYREIFHSNQNQPIIIRLFDPPFSEFFPSSEELFIDLFEFKKLLSKANNAAKRTLLCRKIKKTETLLSAVREFNEDNKMLGHRGCRIAITHPEIYQSQIESIFQALAETIKKKIRCCLNISIPMVINPQEVKIIKKIIKQAETTIEKRYQVKLTYNLGVAIETPRAVALAGQLATEVDFFSFGTNDLTQLIMGISRTDHNSFLSNYQQHYILKNNPFNVIDFVVADFIKQAVDIACKKNKRIFFFINVKDFRDAKMTDKIIRHKGYIVCQPSLAPIIKLSLLK